MKEYIVPLSEEEAYYGYKDMTTELIRCRDCKHRMHDRTCIKVMKRKPDEGYCDEAERKKME